MARPAVTSRTIAARWPAGPNVARMWPGSGLWAGVSAWVSPSGKASVFWIMAPGAARAAGARLTVRTTAAARVVAANRAAVRAPSRKAIMAVSTTGAGHAVYFIAQATARVSAAAQAVGASHEPRPAGAAARAGRMSRARARQVKASTGGSVMPWASGNAMTGDAAANAAQLSDLADQARSRRAMPNAAASSGNVATVSHGRGSPARPGRPSARGSPKMAMTGR
jgi:hypothetical protein